MCKNYCSRRGGGGFLLAPFANTRPHTHLTGSHTHWLVPTHVQWFPDILPRHTPHCAWVRVQGHAALSCQPGGYKDCKCHHAHVSFPDADHGHQATRFPGTAQHAKDPNPTVLRSVRTAHTDTDPQTVGGGTVTVETLPGVPGRANGPSRSQQNKTDDGPQRCAAARRSDLTWQSKRQERTENTPSEKGRIRAAHKTSSTTCHPARNSPGIIIQTASVHASEGKCYEQSG
jgi:hypothetical protein